MGKSSLFLATTILIGTLLLIIFGISALPPIIPDATNDDTNQTTQAAPLEAPTVVFGNPLRGPKEAAVTVVEFGDYQCPACALIDESLNKILLDFPEDVRVVWKDFPNTTQHKESFNAAVAARCAGIQGLFWEYHDILLANQDSINESAYNIFAAQLGLDTEAFAACVKDQVTRPVVERDFEEGQRLRIDATPYVFINKRRVSGAIKYELLREMVRMEIAKSKEAVSVTEPTEP